uniref:serine-rich adhesin for platelets n=1 Tax=Pristiophorus japonicus TaxID=55135 RepID=UPI00398E90E9
MGGKLSRKKKGYNVNDPKESKTTAESTDNPEVKPDEPENQDAAKEQFKITGELPEEKPETEAPKIASETPAEKQTDLAVADVKTEEKATADAPAVSVSADLAHSSNVQESATSTNLVEATRPVPDQAEHCLVTEAEVQFNSTPGIDSSAEVLDVPVPSECETQTGVTPVRSSNGETQEKPALDNVTEASKGPSMEESSLGDHAATKLVEDGQQLEETSCVNLEDIKVESGEVLEKISLEKFHDEMSVPESIASEEKVKVDCREKEKIESSIQEIRSESRVKCIPPEEVEIPKLAEETPIDVVLKNEMASCADNLEKVTVGPDTLDEGEEKVVSESLHPTGQIVADVKTEHSIEKSDIQENHKVELSEALSQLLEGSGNLSVDTSKEDSCSAPKGVTDVVQAKSNGPLAAESAPETVGPNSEKEVTETRYEQTVDMINQDSIEEISLLKTSSELIPDIKLTVYTEALQEEKMVICTELPSKGSTDDQTLPEESIVPDAISDPQPLNEVLAEKPSTSLVEMVFETPVSSDQEMVKLDETLEDPVPESRSSPSIEGPSPTEVIKTEETCSTKTENGVFVDGEKNQSESTSKTEDNISETSVANGTSVDEVRGRSKSTSKTQANGRSEATIAEENLQADTSEELKSGPIECKTIEQVKTNQPLEESGCVSLDNTTVNSGQQDVNAE